MAQETKGEEDTPQNASMLVFPIVVLSGLALWGWYALNVHLMEIGVIYSFTPTYAGGIAWMIIEATVLLIGGMVVVGIVTAVIKFRNKREKHRQQEQMPVQQATDAAV